jgi:hypothetical protein
VASNLTEVPRYAHVPPIKSVPSQLSCGTPAPARKGTYAQVNRVLIVGALVGVVPGRCVRPDTILVALTGFRQPRSYCPT